MIHYIKAAGYALLSVGTTYFIYYLDYRYSGEGLFWFVPTMTWLTFLAVLSGVASMYHTFPKLDTPTPRRPLTDKEKLVRRIFHDDDLDPV